MYQGNKIGVIVPAYNEEKQVQNVLLTMPDFVDKIIVVDDKSSDNTVRIVENLKSQLNDKLILLKHTRNQGVGAAIVTGYIKSIEMNYDISCVMAGDAQMNPKELESLINPIAVNEADYVKGNRFKVSKPWKKIPKIRFIGNLFLSLFTKVVSGYWSISDSQSGYSAIKNKVLNRINLSKVHKRYGYPIDLLVKLNVINCRVKDIAVTPIYNSYTDNSGIKISKTIPSISGLLIKNFFWRIDNKYLRKRYLRFLNNMLKKNSID